jgi:hypothetical protein
MNPQKLLVITAFLSLVSLASHAELSGDDYLGGGAIRTEAERERVRALIDAARQREAERSEALARERAVEESLREARLAAEMASRPVGAVLAETHCSACHAMEDLEAVRHTRLGWSLTIARMRLLNRAPIPSEEAARIREHLARTQPADLARAVVEYGMAAMLALLPAFWALRRWLRRP